MQTSLFVLAPAVCNNVVHASRWSMSGERRPQKRNRIRAYGAAAMAALLSVQLVSVPAVDALAASFAKGMLGRARPTLVVRGRNRVGDPVLDSFGPMIPDARTIVELERAGDSAVDSIAPVSNYEKIRRESNAAVSAVAPILEDPAAALRLERAGSAAVDSIAPAHTGVRELIDREIEGDAIFRTMVADQLATHPDAAGDSAAPPGVVGGVLRSCIPTSLACVSSQDDTPASFVEPWEYDVADSVPLVRNRVRAAITAEGGDVDVDMPPYLRARFGADELELYFTPGDATVQLRADGVTHPRVDFGRNRRRVERIRRAAGLEKLVVLRGRSKAFPLLETPFDSFAPSLPDVDAVIERQRSGDTFLARPTDD